MLQIMYLWIPVVITLIIALIMSRMDVEAANAKITAARNKLLQ